MELNYWNLIAKHVTGELSLEEKQELLSWAEKDIGNAELLKKAERVWELSGDYNFEFSPDKRQDWEEFKDKILAASSEASESIENQVRFKWFGIAASVLLLVGVGFIFKTILTEDEVLEPIVYSEPIIYSDPVVYICVEATDSTNVFYLPDSTRIWLNKNSSLLYPEKFIGAIRNVKLTGEAFFEVVSDTTHPFIVYAGNTQVKVLGTSFNIKAYQDQNEVEVIVVEGRVEFSARFQPHGKKVIVEVDEKAIYNRREKVYIKEQFENKSVKWRLKDIGNDINRFIRTISKKLGGGKKKSKKK